jgi:hypothetical protein
MSSGAFVKLVRRACGGVSSDLGPFAFFTMPLPLLIGVTDPHAPNADIEIQMVGTARDEVVFLGRLVLTEIDKNAVNARIIPLLCMPVRVDA